MFRLASRPCFARHRGVSKNSGALRSVVVLKLGTDGVVGFILEGVSVDLGRTMLPVIDALLVRPTPQVLFAWRRFVFAPIRRPYREKCAHPARLQL
jgi:hypothetical protein